MRLTRLRTPEQAEAKGRQTARAIRSGVAGSKFFPNYLETLAESITAAKASAARVAHDPILAAYWNGCVSELTDIEAEALEAESQRRQQANFNAVADGFAPPYPSEY